MQLLLLKCTLLFVCVCILYLSDQNETSLKARVGKVNISGFAGRVWSLSHICLSFSFRKKTFKYVKTTLSLGLSQDLPIQV